MFNWAKILQVKLNTRSTADITSVLLFLSSVQLALAGYNVLPVVFLKEYTLHMSTNEYARGLVL